MQLQLSSVYYVVAAVVPVLVTAKPQLQLGGIWTGKESESPKDGIVPGKPSDTLTNEGGLQIISEGSDLKGYIQLQVFLGKTSLDGERVKVHDSNSTFTIPKDLLSPRSGIKKCEETELLYESDGQCYQAGPVKEGVKSPCADDFMEFIQLADKPGYGECFCLQFRGSTTRPVVYWEKSNRCYWLYHQGPCEKGEWLVFSNVTNSDNKKSLICSTRTCPENTLKEMNSNFPKFWFEHQGKCFQTETASVEFCGAMGKKIYFSKDKPEPYCDTRRPNYQVKALASGVNLLSCKAGLKKLPSGDCKRIASYERK